jgi:hypothetical protein
MKELKWKHDKDCCNDEKGLEVLTPYPKKRNRAERFLNRYNHIMEFTRTSIQIMVFILQLIILWRISN